MALRTCLTLAIGWIVLPVLTTIPGLAREIHVAKTGADAGDGSRDRPYLTINQAASVAEPGDTVTVGAGTYREWVKPARGGTGEDHRIVFRAARGATVLIKGSERVDTWKSQADGVWQAELPNSLFDDYNPYALKLSGGWLNYGNWHHRGDVYLNGRAFHEMESAAEVDGAARTWHCQVSDGVTTIRANFGESDPNTELAEINVRECIFFPEIAGLQYVTVDGFHFMHAASNWAPPVLRLQTGAVGPRMGKHWIIQNCTVTNARCVGIILGQAPGVDYSDIGAYGGHIIRNNIIRRCGQAGIAGQKGATRSIISGNFIEDTNCRKEFGGWETAAIKFHNSVDTVIRGNTIRGVYRQKQGAFGIWMDFGNQGTRITGNLIYRTEAATVFLEMDHGPTLVDHNILVGQTIQSNSEATVFAHNLFVDCGYSYRPDVRRRSQYYEPHTTKTIGRKSGTAQDDKWFNNIFVRQGLDDVHSAQGYVSDFNLFLEGAKKSVFGDEHSVLSDHQTRFSIEDKPLGATITFTMDDTLRNVPPLPMVDAKRIGVFPTVGQLLEDRHGRPITVNTDVRGNRFMQPAPGPLSDLRPGRNTVSWTLEKK